MKIIIDTREQNPFNFEKYHEACCFEHGTLKTGDYSLFGFENMVTVERKSLNDLIGCLTTGRNRFENELERMKQYESCCVIVESPWKNLVQGKYRSNLNHVSALQSIISFMQKYRVPFIFADSREQAEYLCFSFLKHYFKHNS